MFDWISTLVDALSGAAGSAGEAVGGAAGAAGGAGLDWLKSLGGAAGNNPMAALGLLGQGFGMAAPYLMGGGQQPGQQPTTEMAPQAPQAGGPQAARARLAQMQGQGLSGASPDFLATQLGITPDELDRLMGRGGAR